MSYISNFDKSTREHSQKWHAQTQAGGAITPIPDRAGYAKTLGGTRQQAAFSVSTGIPSLASQPLPSPSPLSRIRQWPGWVTAKGWVKPTLIIFGRELFKLAVNYVIGGQHTSTPDASAPTA